MSVLSFIHWFIMVCFILCTFQFTFFLISSNININDVTEKKTSVQQYKEFLWFMSSYIHVIRKTQNLMLFANTLKRK